MNFDKAKLAHFGKNSGGKALRGLSTAFSLLILYGIAFMIIYPFLFMIVSAFRGREDVMNPTIVWVTRNFTLEHMEYVFDFMKYPELITNTLLIVVGSTVFTVLISSLVGYGFARFQFPGRGVLFALLIFTLIVPASTYITPLYLNMRAFEVPVISQIINLISPGAGTFKLINTPFAFWLQALLGMGFRSGLFIFIFRQFYRGMPKELESAALIDGCGAYKTYLKVMLPNARMTVVTVMLFSIVWYWNDYYTTSVLSTDKRTIAMGLASLRNAIWSAPGADAGNVLLMQVRVQAGALISVLPMLILFIITQRFFTESVERSGIVG